MKHPGISKEKFLCYIKESKGRYNNREIDLFRTLGDVMLLWFVFLVDHTVPTGFFACFPRGEHRVFGPM